jgi:RHS repeat-associated protein
MTTATICATREVSWSLSFYRGEQYDPDLALYYLRARYYNPLTGRFMSRDPNGGYISEPASLHKYLYANGDPVNGTDPSGRACDTCEYIKIAALVVWEDYVATKLFYCSFLGFLAADFKITGAYASHTGNAEAGYWLNQTGNALTLSAIFVCSR